MSAHPLRRIVIYGNEFWDFYNKLPEKVKLRVDWTLDLVRSVEVIPEKYFKHIESTDLYEVRVISGSNIYRIFCFFDKGKLIVLINGFQKKTQKTPKNEIERALRLKKQYYDQK
ncbi:MAG TPA: type II toxin-antitoxin system RelE/ParE family toxin [Chitinophagales bacterium]|nr:type II toxin-antitoxin system RelE/ParE family toxin [Chitinophagales bacterium]HNA65839.1 type II toxin-antitoxin system RelE/ParE family toxin [Saprospiraceae bacterium]HMX04717.1 type II toxin-antitoxin system RelE/ParE family toxin [Chitinophagales bacterium]HMZ89738.1 type II toxin-antitoxin system RelE/ParE family toxin [Chitinophagales bacterium]HNE47007.1 type II toxin-antitoxin system RelE/ParE family toxin [Chitinophagales bacterium]